MTAATLNWASQLYKIQDKNALEFFTDVFLSGSIEDLWDAKKLETRLVESWFKGAKVVPRLDSDLVNRLQKELDAFPSTLRGIADVSFSKELTRDRESEWNDGYYQKGEEPSFEGPDRWVETVSFALYNARVGTPVYQGIGAVWNALRERLRHPEYLFQIGSIYDDENDGDDPKDILLSKELKGLLKTKPKNISSENEEKVRGSNGVYYSSSTWSTEFYANWEAIQSDHQVVERLKVQSHWYDKVEKAKFIFGEDVDEIIKRISSTPVPDGEYEGNPLHSVPKIIQEIEKEHSISADAAALYLQIAALPFPSDANIRLWNGWKKKQHDLAIAELVKVKIVVEAKRAKANRTIFIPGPWEPKQWNKPIESWKFKHLGWIDKEGEVDPYHRPFSFVILTPPHVLFEKTWARIQSGDAPGFEEPPKRNQSGLRKPRKSR